MSSRRAVWRWRHERAWWRHERPVVADRPPRQLRGPGVGRAAHRAARARQGLSRGRPRAGPDRPRRADDRPGDRAGQGDHPARTAGARHRRLPRPDRQAARRASAGKPRPGPAGGLRPHDAALDRKMGATGPGARRDGLARDRRRRPAHLGRAGGSGPARRRRAQPAHGAHLRARGVHHRVRRAGVRADRGPQRGAGPVGRRPRRTASRPAGPRRCAPSTRVGTRRCW